MKSVHLLRQFFTISFAVLVIGFFAEPAAAQGIPLLPSTEESAPSDALSALLDVLRDDDARAALIAELEAATEPGLEATADSDATVAERSLAIRVADATTAFVEDSLATARTLWRDLTGIGSVVSGLSEEKLDRISKAWFPLVLTIVSTVLILWAMTRLADSLLQRFRRTDASDGSLGHTLIALTRNAISDAIILALAYATGYILAYTVFGEMGNVLLEQSLYLNAFLIAGIVRIVLRVFFLPGRPEEAISHLSQPIQSIVYRRAKVTSWLVVYGLSVGVPIANAWVNLATGRSLRVMVVTLAATIALLAIRRVSGLIDRESKAERAAIEREAITTRDLEGVTEAMGEATVQVATSMWNRVWPWLLSIYVISVWIIAISRPRLMADLVWEATAKSLIACALLALAFRVLRLAKKAKAPVFSSVAQSLPELKGRLDGFAPLFVRLAAFVVGLSAIALLLDAWTGLDLQDVLASEAGAEMVWRVASAALVVILIVLMWALISSWIDHRLNLDLDGPKVSARSRTLLALFRNAFTVAIFIFGMMIALSQLGIDIAPLLAGAGVLGLAIGFGAQKLVQDIITGVFIQLENAINEGDVITVGGTTGVVEKLTIRSVAIRDLNGVYHIVPFSSVDTVSNSTRGFGFHVEVVGISYDANVGMAKEAMQAAFDRLLATDEHGPSIIGEMEMHGVVALADSSVNLRSRIRTQPGKQFGLGRVYTEFVKEELDKRGVDIPFPHRKLIVSREDALILASSGSEKPV